jgi:hypothetical protein
MGRGDGMGLDGTTRPSLRLVHSSVDTLPPASDGVERTHPVPSPRRTSPVTAAREPGTTGDWRVFRGCAVGLTATLLAVGGHCVFGEQPPTWPTVVCWAVLLASASTWLSRVRWTFPRLLAVLVAGQAGMHVTFVATQPPVHTGVGAAHAHLHGAAAGTVGSVLPASAAMVAGHLAAAVVTAALLRWGEAWLCGVLDALALRAHRVLDALVSTYAAQPQLVPAAADDTPRLRVVNDAWSERGPPR